MIVLRDRNNAIADRQPRRLDGTERPARTPDPKAMKTSTVASASGHRPTLVVLSRRPNSLCTRTSPPRNR
jgi:hypothetical protein